MSTIRIPKNILYLSDRLPKPTYSKDQSEEEVRGNTAGHSLPFIMPHKKSRKKMGKNDYIEDMGNKYREMHNESLIEEVYIPKGAGVPRKYRPSKKQRPRMVNEDPKVSQSHDAKAEKPLASQEQKHDKDEEDKPPKKLAPAKLAKKLNVVNELSEKEENSNILGHNLGQKSPYIQDAYLHQLVSKHNPIIKPLNENMQKIAEAYSAIYGHGKMLCTKNELKD
jgi:hypothetical protein